MGARGGDLLVDGGSVVPEAVAVVAGLDDVAAVREAVEQGGGHLGVAEDIGPLGEAEVGGDGDAGVLVQLADQVEQQGPSGLRERQVAQFIEDHQVSADQAVGQLALFACGLLQLQCVDQLDGREEAHAPLLVLHGLHAESGGQVGLAGTRTAHEHQVLARVHEVAAMQLPQQRFVHGTLAEVEGAQVAVVREAGRLELVLDGAHFPFGDLGLEQGIHQGQGIAAGRAALFDQFLQRLRHAVQAQVFERGQQAIRLHGAPSASGRNGPCRPPVRPAGPTSVVC